MRKSEGSFDQDICFSVSWETSNLLITIESPWQPLDVTSLSNLHSWDWHNEDTFGNSASTIQSQGMLGEGHLSNLRPLLIRLQGFEIFLPHLLHWWSNLDFLFANWWVFEVLGYEVVRNSKLLLQIIKSKKKLATSLISLGSMQVVPIEAQTLERKASKACYSVERNLKLPSLIGKVH